MISGVPLLVWGGIDLGFAVQLAIFIVNLSPCHPVYVYVVILQYSESSGTS
jgi:hypothetical protein